MQRVGLWHVTDDGPKKLFASQIDLEKHLEDWIAEDPSLLQHGLTIVGRQMGVAGGRLDLLGLDTQGRWAVIEIKSGTVRRETIAQVLDYASCIAMMPQDELYRKVDGYLQEHGSSLDGLIKEWGELNDGLDETRDVMMFVVGTGREPGLERMIDYLSRTHDVPITLVSYEVFEIKGGQRVLVRELTELETALPGVERERPTMEKMYTQAEQAGVGEALRMIVNAAQSHGLYPRPYKQSVMCTPPSDRTRMLFTAAIRSKADGVLQVYVGPGAFAEFYPVTEETVASLLGQEGWQKMTTEDVEAFVANLDRLFEGMEQESE